MVDEPVDHGGGGHVVAEDLAPLAERLVGGDDHRRAFVAVGDQAEHQVRGFGVKRDVADLVDHDQRDERQPLELGLERALALGFRESGDPLGRGRELDALTGEARADRERDREMGLAGPGGSEQDHVLSGVQEVELPEMLDHRLLDVRWKVKSNSSRVLRAGNRAVLIRPSPPWESRAETSVPSSISANRS